MGLGVVATWLRACFACGEAMSSIPANISHYVTQSWMSQVYVSQPSACEQLSQVSDTPLDITGAATTMKEREQDKKY